MEGSNIFKGDIEIGRRVRMVREERNMTQKKLAEKVIVSSSSITRLESGQTMVSVFTIVRIAEVLNVPISYLLFGYEEENDISGVHDIVKKLDKCSADQKKLLLQSFEKILDAFLYK